MAAFMAVLVMIAAGLAVRSATAVTGVAVL
jgi:hypothetical protein